jgi:hypothetical protein
MDEQSAKSAAKALYLQAAALAGLEVAPFSPERVSDLVAKGFARVEPSRRPEAVASLLTLFREILLRAQEEKLEILHEVNVDAAQSKVCPIYPFD